MKMRLIEETFKLDRLVYLYGSAVGLIALSIIVLVTISCAESDMVDGKSIAVLPFDNLNGNEASEYISYGITEEIITQLSKLREIKVISKTSSMCLKNTQKTYQEIGEELGVVSILKGSINLDGDDIQITAKLVDSRTDDQIWMCAYDIEIAQMLAIQSEMILQMASALKIKLSSEERRRIERMQTEDFDVHNYYLKGRYYSSGRTEDGVRIALEYYQRAVDGDPTFARAYAALAEAYILLGWNDWILPKEGFSKAKEAAIKALEIDSTLAEAHTFLGTARMACDWDWIDAEKEFKRAIVLNPNESNAYNMYALYLNMMEKYEESFEQIKQARQLDPLSPTIHAALARNYYYQGEYEEAIKQARKIRMKYPTFVPIYELLYLIYIRQGKIMDATVVVQKGLSRSRNDPRYIAMLGVCYAAGGRGLEALRILGKLKELSKRKYISSYGLAFIYLYLNDKNKFFVLMDKAYEERQWILDISSNPFFDDVRSDPRFTVLLKKIGLEK